MAAAPDNGNDAGGGAEQRGQSRRDEILTVARDLFHRKGYANTSLDDIAGAVGIKREGIYYYFENRVQILITIIKPLGELLRDSLAGILETDAPPVEKLRLAVENHLMRFERRFAESKITLRDDYFSENEAVLAEMGPIWDAYEVLWTRLIREGQQAGAFNDALDPRLAYYGILGMCNWVARWYEPGKPPSVPDLVEQYYALIAGGLIKGGR
ncbi:MAG: TetR family transcriptional regulator [Alphaproteobacteria bacterium]|nr:TetR family transcriptional regulator [Alphaproteobacteria bacterium]